MASRGLAMRCPILRRESRSIFDSILASASPGIVRPFSYRPLTPSSTCLQCRLRPQRRYFADDKKPASSDPLIPRSNLPPEEELFSPSSIPDLPSASESRRSALNKRLSTMMDHLQGNIFIASQRINDLTGYSGIEALKASIAKLEASLEASQESVREARLHYKATIAERASSQREVTNLLARKDTWTPVDLERFTSLYRSDHGNEHAVQEAATKLADEERLLEQASSKLNSSILARYHEEQIWSDKIRRMSTWGTWGLMGVNVLLFFVFQFGFEPWRRARLVKGFEEKVAAALEKEKERRGMLHTGDGEAVDELKMAAVIAAGVEELQEECEGGAQPAVSAVAAVIESDAEGAAPMAPVKDWRQLETWKEGVLDLFSENTVLLRKQDVTVIALEGAATGAALAGLIAMFILRPS